MKQTEKMKQESDTIKLVSTFDAILNAIVHGNPHTKSRPVAAILY